jgi:hypothetical protein
MGVDKLRVDVDVQGEGQARLAASRLEKRAEQVQQKAKQARQEIDRADSGARTIDGRIRGLLDRAKRRGILKEEGLEYGAVKLGRSGIGVSEEWMKGKRGAVAGPLLAVFAVKTAAQSATNFGDQLADWRDQGLSPAEMLREAIRGVGRYATAPSVGLARMLSRWTAGYTAEEAELAADDLVSNAFGSGPSQLDQAIDAQRANRRAFLNNLWEQQEKERAERNRRIKERERAFERIDEAVNARISALRPVSLPTRLTPELQRRIEQEQELRERLRGTVQKVRLGAGVGS